MDFGLLFPFLFLSPCLTREVFVGIGRGLTSLPMCRSSEKKRCSATILVGATIKVLRITPDEHTAAIIAFI